MVVQPPLLVWMRTAVAKHSLPSTGSGWGPSPKSDCPVVQATPPLGPALQRGGKFVPRAWRGRGPERASMDVPLLLGTWRA